MASDDSYPIICSKTLPSLPDCFVDDDIISAYKESGFDDVANEVLEKQLLWRQLLNEVEGSPVIGLTLFNANREQWGVITREFTAHDEPTSFRYTLFDDRGFIMHHTENNPQALLVELFDTGFTAVAPDDTLNLVSKQWRTQQSLSRPNV